MEVGVAVVVVATAEEVVVEATGLASARPANAGTAVPLAPAGHLSAVGGATARRQQHLHLLLILADAAATGTAPAGPQFAAGGVTANCLATPTVVTTTTITITTTTIVDQGVAEMEMDMAMEMEMAMEGVVVAMAAVGVAMEAAAATQAASVGSGWWSSMPSRPRSSCVRTGMGGM